METASVKKQILVAASQEKAFRTFTENFDRWWPRSHHIGKSEMKKAVLESKEGGRWFEIGEDGKECEWGKVIRWNPFSSFLLAWQINGQWQYDSGLITEVEVTFSQQTDGQTLVILEHRNLERFGSSAVEIRKSFESDGGWGGLLKAFAEVAKN